MILPRPRFTLRTLLLLVAAAAIAAAVIGHYFFRPNPITEISTRAQWDSKTANRQCVLLIDGAWSFETARFRKLCFREFADWCQFNTKIHVLTMDIDPADRKNDVWIISEELRQKHNMDRRNIQNLGGAGRVVWIDNGRVVDYAWCVNLMDLDELRA